MHTLPDMQEKRCPTYGPFSSLECLDHSEPDLKKQAAKLLHILTDTATSSALFGRRKNAVQEASVW